jgi:hypothetical protein
MTPNETRTELSRLAIGLLTSGLAGTINTPIIANRNGIARVTWPAADSAEPGFFSTLPFASITEYRRMMLGNHFIALMRDGALLQLSIDIRGNDIIGHRFGYYPCPILLPEDFNILDFEALDLLLIYELEANLNALESETQLVTNQLRMRSPLRFDYAPHAASESEPACHVHLLNRDSRVAVHGALSIGHFVQFVLKHFYKKEWDDHALRELTRWPTRDLNRTISVEEEGSLHITCRRLQVVHAQS